MKTARFLVMFVIIALVVSLGIPAMGAESKGPFVVGFVPRAFVSVYFVTMGDAVKAAAAQKKGIKVEVASPLDQKDIEGQIKIIEDLTQKKVNLLAVSVNDPNACVPSLLEAQKAGIPIILLDTVDPLPGIKVLSLIGSSHYDGGVMSAKYMVKLLDGKGKIAIIEGVAGQYANEQRKLGIQSVFKDYPNIKIVASQPGNWDRATAMAAMENIIQSNLGQQIVYCMNDGMALGAVQALEAATVLDKNMVIGYNADKEAMEAVRNGKMKATVMQQPAKIGQTVIDIAEMIRDGKKDKVKPLMKIPIVLITSDNVNDYLKK
jgi:ABC-type sugar transport system substrate-binding protein